MSRATELGNKLYRGEVSYPIVGRQRTWYAISGVIVLLSLLALFLPGRGLNFGIEFRGGAEFRFTSTAAQEGRIRDVVAETGVVASSARPIHHDVNAFRHVDGAVGDLTRSRLVDAHVVVVASDRQRRSAGSRSPLTQPAPRELHPDGGREMANSEHLHAAVASLQ